MLKKEKRNREIIIWAAGFFDGEGSITIQKANGYNLQVNIVGSNLSALNIFKEYWGGKINIMNRIGDEIGKTGYKVRHTAYQLSFNHGDKETKQLLQDLLPYLVVKKELAELALEYLEGIRQFLRYRPTRGRGIRMSRREIKYREEMWKKFRDLQDLDSNIIPDNAQRTLPL